MTTSLQPASLGAPPRTAVGGRGLLAAGRALLYALVLPYVALLGLQLALSALPVTLSRGLALVGPAFALVVLWRWGSAYVLWAAFLLVLQVHAAIWGALPSLGMQVHFEYVAALDRVLGLGELPTVTMQSAHARTPYALDVAAVAVYASFFVLPVVAFLLAWRLDRGLAATFARAMTCASFLSLAVMAALPTAPPWMASAAGTIPPIERIAETVVGQAAHEDANEVIGVNEVAAMPSLHTGITVLIALLLASALPPLRRWAWLYPLAMGVSLVYLGEHYAIDVLAGAGLAWLSWRLARLRWGPFAEVRMPDRTDAAGAQLRAA